MKRVLTPAEVVPVAGPARVRAVLLSRRGGRAHNDVARAGVRPAPMRGVPVPPVGGPRGAGADTRLVYRRPRCAPRRWRPSSSAWRLRCARWGARAGAPTSSTPTCSRPASPPRALRAGCGCQVVVSEHFTAFQRGLVRGADLSLARYRFRYADLVCPVSEDLRAQLEAVEPRGRYRVVPNVVDTSIFHPGRAVWPTGRCGCSTSRPGREEASGGPDRCASRAGRRSSTSSARARWPPSPARRESGLPVRFHGCAIRRAGRGADA